MYTSAINTNVVKFVLPEITTTALISVNLKLDNIKL